MQACYTSLNFLCMCFLNYRIDDLNTEYMHILYDLNYEEKVVYKAPIGKPLRGKLYTESTTK